MSLFWFSSYFYIFVQSYNAFIPSPFADCPRKTIDRAPLNVNGKNFIIIMCSCPLFHCSLTPVLHCPDTSQGSANICKYLNCPGHSCTVLHCPAYSLLSCIVCTLLHCPALSCLVLHCPVHSALSFAVLHCPACPALSCILWHNLCHYRAYLSGPGRSWSHREY